MLLHILRGKCLRLSYRVVRCYSTGDVVFASTTPHLRMRVPPLGPAQQTKSLGFLADVVVPEGYEKIYEFKGKGTIQFFYGTAAVIYLFIAGRLLYNAYGKETETTTGESSPPQPTPTPQEPTPAETAVTPSSWLNRLSDRMMKKDPISESFALAMTFTIMAMMNFMVQRIVIKTYRRGNNYISTFLSRFGTMVNVVEHGKHECLYFTKNVLFKYTLHGRVVLIDPQFYVSKSEEMDMCYQVEEEKQ